MLKLREVSKYYARNGNVSLGLRNINLEFKQGEFVAIIGESGSGKSTLLNVLSGIDTYEEGELFVNGQETSHFTVQDWENYRKHNIGFVFQNYNIIDSFTVYQNVETALIIAGYAPTMRKARALELIEQVGLSRYIHTKASKLSGGQMQRTVIARALAKDCPIIIADEPTGNLDSEASKKMIQLLSDISKDKLVIMVTHNVKEVEHAITRKITLHDGHIVEDQQLDKLNRSAEDPVLPSSSFSKSNKIKDTIKMATRFVLATPMKSLLIFTVLLMLCLGSAFIYGNMLNIKNTFDKNPQNMYFPNSSERRIVLHKSNLSAITSAEASQLRSLDGVQDWVPGDVALDMALMLQLPKQKGKDSFTITTGVSPWSLIEEEQLIAGELPQQDHEIVLNTQSLRKGFQANELLNHNITITDKDKSYQVTIVGIADDSKIGEMIFLSPTMINTLATQALSAYQMTFFSMDPLEAEWFVPEETIVSNSIKHETYVHINDVVFQQYCSTSNTSLTQCEQQLIGKPIKINVLNNYTNMQHTYIVEKIIENKSEESNPIIYFSAEGLKKLYQQEEVYQGSLIVKKKEYTPSILNQLEALGYKALYPYATVSAKSPFTAALQFIALAGFVTLFIGIFFFIGYFILKNMMRSKQKDYIILRSIGASSRVIYNTIFIEILLLSTLAYLVSLVFSKLSQWLPAFNSISFISNLFKFYSWQDYLMMYLIVIIMTLLLVNRVRKHLYTGSVITILKGD